MSQFKCVLAVVLYVMQFHEWAHFSVLAGYNVSHDCLAGVIFSRQAIFAWRHFCISVGMQNR